MLYTSTFLYHGLRLLIKRGIEQKCTPKGQIVATLVTEKFAFNNSVYGIKLQSDTEWQYKCILGILWSTLAKYYLLLTSYDWGVWHDEIRFEDELLEFPICLPQKESLKNHIIRLVEELRTYDPVVRTDDMFNNNGVLAKDIAAKRRKLEVALDDAIFELYGLGEAEIDLIRDMCETNLEYYYSPDKSSVRKPVLTKRLSKPYGKIESLPKDTVFSEYLEAFIKSWIPYLDDGTEFAWRVYQSEQTGSMIAVVFSIQDKTKNIDEHIVDDITCWNDVLVKLKNDLTQPFHSSRINIEGTVWAVTDDFIMIIKHNERRLWTKSIAREDAEATFVKATNRKGMRGRIRKIQ